MLNFVTFIEWPESSSDDDTFVIGVLGADPFADVLDAMVAGEQAGGRRIIVRRFASAKAAAESKMVFLSASDPAGLDGALQELKGHPVLTVSETRDFARRGGMIQFRLVDKRVRFEVNVGASRRAGLSVSSHLLRLAMKVHEDVDEAEAH